MQGWKVESGGGGDRRIGEKRAWHLQVDRILSRGWDSLTFTTSRSPDSPRLGFRSNISPRPSRELPTQKRPDTIFVFVLFVCLFVF